ncbi:MAG TPA: hypothetical protein VJN43_22220 [Bryobacteraceae bacterium]|nr:hypothetical protein [Bryobacteraceae bacterium]
MMTYTLLTLLLMQSSYYNPQMPKGYQMVPEPPPHTLSDPIEKQADDRAAEEDARNQQTARQRQFAYSFNRLLDTLRSFATAYNADHTVDVKKVRAIKKAWRDLESSDPWFKLEKK